jgi:crossover junction endodeoxyribonuclease RusA
VPVLSKTHNAPFSTFKYVLPFPPSVNHYWRTARRGSKQVTYISKEGVQFGKDVDATIGHRPHTRRRLEVTLQYQRGDHTNYDVDNYAKSTLDALAKAGVLCNDQQVDRLVQERLPVVKGQGRCFVTIKEIGHACTTLSF